MNIQHSSRTDLWGTPIDIIEAARDVLGGIDLDPASDERFNARVGASKILTASDDALVTPWPNGCSVFLNPPGGKRGRDSMTVLFWQRLLEYRQQGSMKHAIFLAFSLEALQTTQQCELSIGHFTMCIPRRRLRFVSPDGATGEAPSHSNVIAYLPGTVQVHSRFVSLFSQFGICIES